jgi:hypothetical protein
MLPGVLSSDTPLIALAPEITLFVSTVLIAPGYNVSAFLVNTNYALERHLTLFQSCLAFTAEAYSAERTKPTSLLGLSH